MVSYLGILTGIEQTLQQLNLNGKRGSVGARVRRKGMPEMGDGVGGGREAAVAHPLSAASFVARNRLAATRVRCLRPRGSHSS